MERDLILLLFLLAVSFIYSFYSVIISLLSFIYYIYICIDLGESKSVDETKELYAGTSRCLQLSHDYLAGFGTPFDVVGGKIKVYIIEYIDLYLTIPILNIFLQYA